jgi:hypothetical protein
MRSTILSIRRLDAVKASCDTAGLTAAVLRRGSSVFADFGPGSILRDARAEVFISAIGLLRGKRPVQSLARLDFNTSIHGSTRHWFQTRIMRLR